MGSLATPVNIEVDQGTTKVIEYDWIDESTQLPIDLTGYTARMQVRPKPGDALLYLDYNTNNGKITLGGVAGTISVTISPSDTTTFVNVPEWRRAFYDLFIVRVADGSTTMIARGEFTILGSITV